MSTCFEKVFFVQTEREIRLWVQCHAVSRIVIDPDVRKALGEILFIVDESKWRCHYPNENDVAGVIEVFQRNKEMLRNKCEELMIVLESFYKAYEINKKRKAEIPPSPAIKKQRLCPIMVFPNKSENESLDDDVAVKSEDDDDDMTRGKRRVCIKKRFIWV